ncbi:hypothetical protein [Clostridium butyricum]|uniref:hypothetical protein n=1 Tax=Clostridium butyricum TaxID=1492 RepID=UPI00374F09A6
MIKSIQSQINKLETEIKKYNDEISKAYTILNSYNNEDISFDTWLKNKSNIKLVDEIEGNIGKLEIERNNIKEELIEFKTEQQIKEIRREKERVFFGIFTNYLRELNVKMLEGNRYTALYKISAFPSQGVELHKTVLAYNVAFNNLISKTNNIHRCPFMLDGIFKEDIEEDNKSLILKFLGNNRPNDTQLIISIAELQKNKEKIQKYNKDYFNGDANIICIGDGCRERAFLQDYDSSINSILNETELIITEV